MRYVGRITDWNDEKGFGFVAPNGGRWPSLRAHQSLRTCLKAPVSGQLISYELATDEQGRFKAAGNSVRRPSAKKAVSSNRAAWPRKIIGAAFLVLLALAWLSSRMPLAVLLAYAGASLVALILYGADKSAAENNRWRTPESTLHVVALFGGWPGALIAQGVFRHKSTKEEFQTVFWTTVVLNCAALLWLLESGKAVAINRAIFAP
jgi:uncharacterized membrane protein YsdA (DUF1294 family)/cold shock CspA family protein